jgi:AcrR family transcriptional regulator
MTIPHPPQTAAEAWALPDPELDWATLSQDAKRERILCAAGRVFAADGLDAPMPAVAAAAGAGVASVYRQFPSKTDLLAALVNTRLRQIRDAVIAAAERDVDRWTALTEMLWMLVERQSADDLLGEAWQRVSDHPAVADASREATEAIGRLVVAAQAEGSVRADANAFDIRLLFAATRAASSVDPTAWRRMLTLLIDGLRAPAR